MKTITVELDNDKKYKLEGFFEFEISRLPIMTLVEQNNYAPVKEVKFGWNVEIPQGLDLTETEDELLEKVGERLKKDFIQFIKTADSRIVS